MVDFLKMEEKRTFMTYAKECRQGGINWSIQFDYLTRMTRKQQLQKEVSLDKISLRILRL